MEDGGEASSSSSSEVRSVSSHVDVPRIPNPQLKKLLFFKVYKRRWFVLLVLCLLNCSNATVSWQQVSDRWWVHVKFEMQLVFHRCFLSKFESVWFKSSIPGSFTGKQTIFFMVKTKNNNNIVYLRGKKKIKGTGCLPSGTKVGCVPYCWLQLHTIWTRAVNRLKYLITINYKLIVTFFFHLS